MDDLNRRLTLLKKLTARQREVLALKAQGKSVKEIAAALNIVERTVKYHLGQTYDKLEIAHLAQWYRQQELMLFGTALKQMPPDSAPINDEPEPPLPSPRALIAVEEDERALVPTEAGESEDWDQRKGEILLVPPKPRPWWRKPWIRAVILVIIAGLISGIVVLAGQKLILGGTAPAVTLPTPVAMPSQATPPPQVVEKVVTHVVTAVVTQVVTEQVVITATPGPTSTNDPILTIVAQAPSTATAFALQMATAEATKKAALAGQQTAVAGQQTAVAAQQTAEAAAFRATHPPLLGQAIELQGLSLIARPGVHPDNTGGTMVPFTVENQTGQALNFNILQSDFYLELSNGRRYPGGNDNPNGGHAPIAINGFETNTQRDFEIFFSLGWSELQAYERDPTITHYFVVVTTFGEGRITKARWCHEIRGTPCR